MAAQLTVTNGLCARACPKARPEGHCRRKARLL